MLTQLNLGDNETLAMYSKGNTGQLVCTSCGKRGHTNDRCWGVTGFPKWHYKYKPGQKAPTGKWQGNRAGGVKMANNAQTSTQEQQTFMMTSQQLDQLLKMIPRNETEKQKETETDEEIDYGFSGMVQSNAGKLTESTEWIIDSGASDHMTSSLHNLINVKLAPATFNITLPTGDTTSISHIGDTVLPNGLKLFNVLYVPQFNHNLISIHKLVKDSKCDVIFRPE